MEGVGSGQPGPPQPRIDAVLDVHVVPPLLGHRAAHATARLIGGAGGGGEAALDHADLGAGHGGVVHGDAVGAADAPALSVERLSQLRGAAAVRGG